MVHASTQNLTWFKRSSMGTVVSQSTHASVILTPYLRAPGPSGGTSCRPALIWDSSMTPVSEVSPAAIWSARDAMTFG